MEQYIIKGGNPLVGEVDIAGAKNCLLYTSIMSEENLDMEEEEEIFHDFKEEKEEKTEIPDLESEDIIENRFTENEEKESEDEELLRNIMSEENLDMEEEEEIFHDFKEEEEEIPEEILPESMRFQEEEPSLDEEDVYKRQALSLKMKFRKKKFLHMTNVYWTPAMRRLT